MPDLRVIESGRVKLHRLLGVAVEPQAWRDSWHALAFRLFVPGPPPLAVADHLGQVVGRTNLPRPLLHARMLGHQLDGMVQVPRLQNEYPAELLFRLGIRAVGDRDFPVVEPQGGGAPRALERFAAGKVTVLFKQIVVGEALVHHGVQLVFGHRLPNLLVDVSQADVFHGTSYFRGPSFPHAFSGNPGESDWTPDKNIWG